MILFILAILTLITFGCWILIKHPVLRYGLSFISALLLVIAIVMVSLNMKSHWGMVQKVTTSKPIEIYSAGPKGAPLNILVTKRIGKTNNYVMVFKDHPNDKKAEPHFVPNQNDLVRAVKESAVYQMKNVSKATYVVKTTSWEYKSDLFRILFKLGDSRDNIIKQETIVRVPKQGWRVLSEKQAKKMLASLK